MTFFDKMSETISSKSKDVAKKAKEIAEVTSLNSKISAQQDLIAKTHKELGAFLCEHQEDWKEQDITGFFDGVETAKTEILRLQDEIRKVKGVKLCPGCGKEIGNEAAFCPFCGTPAPIVVEEPVAAETAGETAPEALPVVLTCPECGKEVACGTAFCTECGAKIAREEA